MAEVKPLYDHWAVVHQDLQDSQREWWAEDSPGLGGPPDAAGRRKAGKLQEAVGRLLEYLQWQEAFTPEERRRVTAPARRQPVAEVPVGLGPEAAPEALVQRLRRQEWALTDEEEAALPALLALLQEAVAKPLACGESVAPWEAVFRGRFHCLESFSMVFLHCLQQAWRAYEREEVAREAEALVLTAAHDAARLRQSAQDLLACMAATSVEELLECLKAHDRAACQEGLGGVSRLHGDDLLQVAEESILEARELGHRRARHLLAQLVKQPGSVEYLGPLGLTSWEVEVLEPRPVMPQELEALGEEGDYFYHG